MKNVMALMMVLGLGLGCGSGASQLNAPTNLQAMILTGGAHLTWTDNAKGEDMYMIERKDPGGQFVAKYNVTFDITQYHDSAVTKGATYLYRVMAMSGATASPYSNEVSIAIP